MNHSLAWNHASVIFFFDLLFFMILLQSTLETGYLPPFLASIRFNFGSTNSFQLLPIFTFIWKEKENQSSLSCPALCYLSTISGSWPLSHLGDPLAPAEDAGIGKPDVAILPPRLFPICLCDEPGGCDHDRWASNRSEMNIFMPHPSGGAAFFMFSDQPTVQRKLSGSSAQHCPLSSNVWCLIEVLILASFLCWLRTKW